MNSRFAIVGNGIMGAWLALTLKKRGFETWWFGKTNSSSEMVPPSYAAGGLLCPFTELDTSHPRIAELGADSCAKWHELHQAKANFFFQQRGSLVVTYPQDRNLFERLSSRLQYFGFQDKASILDRSATQELEPELPAEFTKSLFFPDEGNLHALQALQAVKHRYRELGGIYLESDSGASIAETNIEFKNERTTFEATFDCRGCHAKPEVPTLRGVRGDRLTIHAPEVSLTRPIRLLHPTTPLYIAPLCNQEYIVGATCLESEDHSPISVRSLLELLTAAFSVHTGFADAVVIQQWSSHRPALIHNEPRCYMKEGTFRINGLFRHGYLLAPQIAELISNYLETPFSHWLFEEDPR